MTLGEFHQRHREAFEQALKQINWGDIAILLDLERRELAIRTIEARLMAAAKAAQRAEQK